MASEAEIIEETKSHHSTPAGGAMSVEHVETSTKATQDAPPHKPLEETIMPPNPEDSSGQDITDSPPQQLQQVDLNQDAPAMVLVTESGPLQATKVSEDVTETVSVVSMPAAVPSSSADNSGENSESVLVAPSDNDGATVASAPAVVVDVDGGIGSSELEDIMQSPHGNNAIVERSPGGRYVRFMEKLGSGASKDVYRAYDTQEGIEVAWNVVHLAGVPKNDRNRIVNEVRLLERLHHHNIISFHGSWVNREKQQVNFVTEILSSGTLQSFINKVQVIRWKIAKRWAVQILKGLEYLHSQDPPVIHRDLKCQNIFINGTSGDLRIGDLGLSTVHRNGKALSVLGTPEFMAPDMYEESAYDEKVDIYAFGMCLLEIFTKEIPYRECNNPAQIYKKVTRGDPPDSLRRLKSRHAREFINLCLGTKTEDGKYIRPSATELLAHPFLQQRPSDEDEVEVEAPLQEKIIREVPETSSGGAKVASKATTVESSKQAVSEVVTAASSSPQKLEKHQSSNSLEDESDRFEEMPDSEMNFRKPKVLMGRGKELRREGDALPPVVNRQASGDSMGDTQAQAVPQSSGIPVGPAAQVLIPEQQAAPAPAQSPAAAFHFLVAAAVIEDEFSNSRPYEDDVLKLVVTLPVDGQTQNVQFDFHLVEDDPIQVAKEMVAELGIPQAAVLEISETISGLARAARIKQDKYVARISDMASHARSRSQSQAGIPQSHELINSQHQSIGHGPNMMQVQSHQPIPDYSPPAMPGQQGTQPSQHHHQQGIPPQDQSPHLHGQQMGQQATLPQSHMHTQHHGNGESVSSLPLNPQFQNQPIQSVGQHMSQADQTIQTAPAQMGHSQHQQSWNPHAAPTPPPPPDASANAGQQNFVQMPGLAPIVRSISTDASLPSSAYGQVPLQHSQVQNQPHGQNGGQRADARGAYGQVQMQHAQMQSLQGQNEGPYSQVPMQNSQMTNQQGQNGGQQGLEGQGIYNPGHLQHAQIPPQQHVQNGGQQGVDGQTTYNQAQMQHSNVPPQQGQNGQQGLDGQSAYNQTQRNPQMPSQQQGQTGGQQGVDSQGVYSQVPMQQQGHQMTQQHVDSQSSFSQAQMQQGQHVGQHVDNQNAFNQAQMHHTQAPSQQQHVDNQNAFNQAPMQHAPPSHHPGQQQQVDNQNAYGQAPMQQALTPSQQQVHHMGQQQFDGQNSFNQPAMQHAPPSQQQGHQMTQQHVDNQNAFSQTQMQQAQAPSQQQGHHMGQQLDQNAFNQAQMQHVQAPSQQHVQHLSQQHQQQQQQVDNQNAFSQTPMHHAQAPTQQQGQVPNQQQGQHSGHRRVDSQNANAFSQAVLQHTDSQNAFSPAPMQHAQAPSQQQGQHPGHRRVDSQNANAFSQAAMQHADSQNAFSPSPMQHGLAPSQQQGQHSGHRRVDSQNANAFSQGQNAFSQALSQQQSQNAFNQTSMQHTQVHSQQQQVHSGGQAGAAQNHLVQAQQAGQSAPQGPSGPVPTPAQFTHQPQRQGSVPQQGQGMSVQQASSYQSPASDPQSQVQFVQHQVVPQNAGQQMPVGPNQGYGNTIGMQQQSPQPVGQPQTQQQQQQQQPPLQPQNPQTPSHPPQQQQPISNLPSASQHNQGPPKGLNQQLPENAEETQQPVVSAAGPPAVASNDEATPIVPSQVIHTAVDASRGLESLSDIASQLPGGDGDQVVSMDKPLNGVHGAPSIEISDDALDDDELLAAELRKLDEDFQKNMMRAQRVFDTRMDNLARSQVQREAQHLKTLEKHEKERLDFEKRRLLEEEEQNRRIEQLREEWAIRREAMRQKQLAEAQAAEAALLSTSPTEKSGLPDIARSTSNDDVAG